MNRAGAVCYVLWGLVHVVGGASLLATLQSGGGAELLRVLASAAPAAVPDTVPAVAGAVAGFHAWNILWIGALVAVVALRLNWRNARLGFWLNLVLAGAADLGLIFALLVPGYMRLADGMIGIALFVPAAALTALGLVLGRGAELRAAT